MKILITGFNRNQCVRKFYLRQQLSVLSSVYSLYNCLTDMGHEVIQKEIELGEDLSEYDKVFVYAAGPRQRVGINVYKGLYAISERPDAIIAYDDWQVNDIFNGLEKCKDDSELFAQFVLDNNGIEESILEKYKPNIKKGVLQLLKRENPVLICAYNSDHLNDDSYGPHTLFDGNYSKDLVFGYNPNPYNRNRKNGDFGNEGPEDPDFDSENHVPEEIEEFVKRRQFNFASLLQGRTLSWIKKIGINRKDLEDPEKECFLNGWPVIGYGKRGNQKRLKEAEICKVFNTDWVCLMPAYKFKKSGWWRIRVLQVADGKSILFGDPDELKIYYGQDFEYLNVTALELTNMTDDELTKIANSQHDALYKLHPLCKETQKKEIQKVLNFKA